MNPTSRLNNKYICIHGHFYQPPRENPWLGEVEFQDSSYPYANWNQRVTAECYARNTASRILGSQKKIIDISNNYSRMSFNFGPSLLSWMERKEPEAYKAILDADRLSRKHFNGHGSAIAQAYNHMIMPLANRRDKRTQVLWGIKDFEHRFQRKPEGMWLPETAVDYETLESLAENGITFTILAPRQAKRVRKMGDQDWEDVGERIDPKRAYQSRLPSGKTIALFFYDGPISQAVSFEKLLASGEDFAGRLLGAFESHREGPQLISIATDGETYGHHHTFGDMALAYCLYHIEDNQLANLTVYADFLKRFPPEYEVEIYENSSWSCFHGVDRWKKHCGCHSGLKSEWNQKWRKPLRESLDWLRDEMIKGYEKEMSLFCEDVWGVRDHYIEVVLNRDRENVKKFIAQNTQKKLSQEETIKFLRLCEMQLNAMLMYTSCGWFWDDISNIETIQIISYAARAIQLAEQDAGLQLEKPFLKKITEAKSNILKFENAAKIYEQQVRPSIVNLLRVGAHYAVSSLFEEYEKETAIYNYSISNQHYEKHNKNKKTLAYGLCRIASDITWYQRDVCFAVFHKGDHNLIGGVAQLTEEKDFTSLENQLKELFNKEDDQAINQLIEEHFLDHHFSLWHLFKDEQRKVLLQILDTTLEEVETSLKKITQYHHPIIDVVQKLHIPLPKILASTLVVMLNTDLLRVLSIRPIDFERVVNLVNEIKEWSLEIDKVTLEFVVSGLVNEQMVQFFRNPQDDQPLIFLRKLFDVLKPLRLNLNIWKAQNMCFAIGKEFYQSIKKKAETGDQKSAQWIEHFDGLSDYLEVKSGG